MNPETGKVEKVMGATADGLNVFESHGVTLKFTPLCWERVTSSNVFQMWIEFQRDENGKRWPHIGIMFGEMLFQSGWLFG